MEPDLAIAGSDANREIEDWRLYVLTEAGYPLEGAEELARRRDIDLHEAVELVKKRGCAPETALAILL